MKLKSMVLMFAGFASVQSLSQGAPLTPKKIDKQPCGIITTETFCSVEVDSKIYQAAASSCDSPIPDLKAQLFAAGLEDLRGLVATCESFQPYGESSFSVPLAPPAP